MKNRNLTLTNAACDFTAENIFPKGNTIDSTTGSTGESRYTIQKTKAVRTGAGMDAAGKAAVRQCRKKEKRTSGLVFSVLFAVTAFIAVLLLATERWAFSQWEKLDVDEILFQLQAPIEGTGNNMVGNYVVTSLVPAIVAGTGAFALGARLRKRKPGTAKHVAVIGFALALIAAAAAVWYGASKIRLGTYIANHTQDSTWIEDNYADPGKTAVTFPEKKRNLIYIFLESMETTSADAENGGGMPQNYIPELTKLAEENECFAGNSGVLNGGRSLTGATWTVGAMFAQTSGLPLKISMDNNGMSSQEQFFPGITTLGDILEKEGYKQYLCIGSHASFGGRKLYFTEHGGYEIYDYDYAVAQGKIPEDYYRWWGFEDEKLFDYAKEHLTEIGGRYEQDGTPFNFTMLTVDTHFPDGYVCRLCDDEFEGNQYANVFHCSSKQVTAFVDWIREQPWYADTTVIISGDHPTMDADYCDGVSADYVRRVYTCYLNSAAVPADQDRKRDYTTMDDFPTTLAALGCTIDGDRLGLGTNLFSATDTLTEELGAEEEDGELQRASKWMSAKSGISEKVVKMREGIAKMQAKVSVEDAGDYIYFHVTGLEKLEKKYGGDVQYVYVHIRNANQLTLTTPRLNYEDDGSYGGYVPKEWLQGYKDITYMLRILTDNGTIDMTDAVSWSIPE